MLFLHAIDKIHFRCYYGELKEYAGCILRKKNNKRERKKRQKGFKIHSAGNKFKKWRAITSKIN